MTSWENWQAFYASDLQSPWLLLVAPTLFLLWRAVSQSRSAGVAPARAGFVAAWCLTFAVETMIDPLATGPLTRSLGLTGLTAQAVMLLFVLLGDFRIWWLVFHTARPGSAALRRALVPTLAIPIGAYATYAALDALASGIPGQMLWLVHETSFLVTALWLRALWLPRHVEDARLRAFLSDALLYSAAYYFLWASADVIILAGSDLGWALRVIPNQLYYSFCVPFIWWRFFAAR
jgi:hypothetical protein